MQVPYYLIFRWPAVISRDTNDGKSHVMDDDSGEDPSYHVEFLGGKHSHAWVSDDSIDLYNQTDEDSLGLKFRKKKRLTNKVYTCIIIILFRIGSLYFIRGS